jgi:hypothetical protein
MLERVLESGTTLPDGQLYENDFYAWTRHQAMVLRTMTIADNRFDRENVAEEIEDLGRCERDAARSQIRRIIEHLLKLAHPPAQAPRFDWMASIAEARATLGDKISPTLRRDAEAMFAKFYREGRRQAELSLRAYGEDQGVEEMPQSCPYSLDDICREDWYPEPPGEQP